MSSLPVHPRAGVVLRVAKNAASLTAADLVARLSNAVLSVSIIRQLDREDYGAYSTIMAFLLIGGLLAEFGLSQVLMREIAQNKNRSSELLSGAVIAVIPLAGFASIGIILVAFLLRYTPQFGPLAVLASISVFTNTLILLTGAVLRAFERMGILSLINGSTSALSAGIGVLWLQYGAGLRELVLLLTLSSALTCLIFLYYTSRGITRLRFTRAIPVAKTLLRGATPLAILGLCAVILQRFDVLVLSKICGLGEAAIYSASVTIVETLTLLTQSVIGAAFPYVALSWKESPLRATRNYELMLRIFSLIGMGMTTSLFFLADKIVSTLYQEAYVGSAACLRILVWPFMLNTLSGPVGMLLIVTKDRLKRFIPYALLITGLSALLNLLVTPKYGYIGASWVTLLVSFLLFTVKVRALRDILPSRPHWFGILWRPIAAAAVLGTVLWRLGDSPLSFLIPFGFLIYSGALLAFGEFAGEYQVVLRYLKRPIS